MAECLVVATKRAGSKARAAYSNLTARPSSLLEAAVGAKNAKGRAVEGDVLDGGAAGVRSMSVIEAARDLEMGTSACRGSRKPPSCPLSRSAP